jgi:hypothetical protein
MRVAEFINERLLAPFDLWITRASSWRQKQERDALAVSNAASERILKLGSLLMPQRAVGYSKARIGSTYDGGYICLDDFSGITTAFSCGVGENDDWDIDIANRGIPVHQFDFSVDAPPHVHQNCRFYKKKIVPIADGTSDTESISRLVEKLIGSEPSLSILKIDIEGDEWRVFEEATNDELTKFSQIVCEFHHFSRVANDEWYKRAYQVLRKLSQSFAVIHVHGNNVASWANVGSVPFPELLEVTYASRARYNFAPCEEIFPTCIDAPNDPDRPDMFIGRFAF